MDNRVLEGDKTMGETEIRTPESWGMPLTRFFDHKLVRLLSEADAAALGREECAAVIYDELRSFMALKGALKTGDPPEPLGPANVALLHFAARLFKAANQALLNHGQKNESSEGPRRQSKGGHRPLVPAGHFLLEWQLVRMRSARQRLVMELAEVSEADAELYRRLALPESLGAEVESARMCVSGVWDRLPGWRWPSPRRVPPGSHPAS